jgi:hypothetical protein
MEERQYIKKNRVESKMESTGQPDQFFCLIDAMTCSRGDVPQVGSTHRQSKSEITHTIENRVIGG